jgi:hypothetical protein
MVAWHRGVGDCVLSRFALNYWFPYASSGAMPAGRAPAPREIGAGAGSAGDATAIFSWSKLYGRS